MRAASSVALDGACANAHPRFQFPVWDEQRTQRGVAILVPRAPWAATPAGSVNDRYRRVARGNLTCGSSKSRTPQKPWLSDPRPDSLSGMRKMLIVLLVGLLHRLDRALAASYFECLAVRQQLAVLNRKTPRPRLRPSDRWFWVLISSLWPAWRGALAIVKPATVIGWHRKGFRLFWTWKSRSLRSGRPPVSREVRDLIRRMCRENPLWGAPCIHGELLKLGFDVSERTVRRCRICRGRRLSSAVASGTRLSTETLRTESRSPDQPRHW